jgi:hypothetical protein
MVLRHRENCLALNEVKSLCNILTKFRKAEKVD